MSLHGRWAILLTSCFFTLAAHGQNCPTVLTYTPATPVLGEPITVTFTVLSTPPPTATSGFKYLPIIRTTEPGAPPEQSPLDVLLYVQSTPASYSFTFTPYEPGQVTVNASSQWYYDFGQTAICGESLTTPPVTIPVSEPLNALNGQYTFLFQGTLPQVKRASQSIASAGSFTADGKGNITGGVEDVTSSLGINTKVLLTGTYSFDPTGRGSLKLHSSLGVQSFKFFVQPTQFNSPFTIATLFSDDGYAVFGSGTLAKQSPVPGRSARQS